MCQAPRARSLTFTISRTHARARTRGSSTQVPRALEAGPGPYSASFAGAGRGSTHAHPRAPRSGPRARLRSPAARRRGGSHLGLCPPADAAPLGCDRRRRRASPASRPPSHPQLPGSGREGGARQSPDRRSAAGAGDATPDPGRPPLQSTSPGLRADRAVGSAAPGPDWGRVAARAVSGEGRGRGGGSEPTSRKFPTPSRGSQHRPRCAACAQEMSLSSRFSPRESPAPAAAREPSTLTYPSPLHFRGTETWSPSSYSGLRGAGGLDKWEEPSENTGHFVTWDPGAQRRQGKSVRQRERSPDPRPAAGAEPCRGSLSSGRPAGPAPRAPVSRSAAERLIQRGLEDPGPQEP